MTNPADSSPDSPVAFRRPGGHYHDVLAELKEPSAELRRHIEDVYAGFAQLHKASLAGGVLSAGTKELIATAIAIAEQCDGCIASHARGAARKGVTPAEFAEMVGVAILMQGGPATIYGPRAWDAFMEFLPADVVAPAHAGTLS
jgi:AhpD family alkylhydroperoxidase